MDMSHDLSRASAGVRLFVRGLPLATLGVPKVPFGALSASNDAFGA